MLRYQRCSPHPSPWRPLGLGLLQITITVLHLGRMYTKSQWFTGLLALQCILLILRLQYYTQVGTLHCMHPPHLVNQFPVHLAAKHCSCWNFTTGVQGGTFFLLRDK